MIEKRLPDLRARMRRRRAAAGPDGHRARPTSGHLDLLRVAHRDRREGAGGGRGGRPRPSPRRRRGTLPRLGARGSPGSPRPRSPQPAGGDRPDAGLPGPGRERGRAAPAGAGPRAGRRGRALHRPRGAAAGGGLAPRARDASRPPSRPIAGPWTSRRHDDVSGRGDPGPAPQEAIPPPWGPSGSPRRPADPRPAPRRGARPPGSSSPTRSRRPRRSTSGAWPLPGTGWCSGAGAP